jgi:riboflavin kinase / FMN adenylyltransferase
LRVYKGIESYKKVKNPVVTTGTFDGVHLGHQKIISRLKEIARKEDGEVVLLTFHPHPRMVLFPDDNELHLLSSLDEKIHLLEQLGVEHLVIIPFTKEFSRLSSMEFVRNILVNTIGTRKLVIGYNHHFGRNREGSFEHLKEYGPLYGFDVEEIPALDVDDVEVSSTKIRKALEIGEIEVANSYLGYPYLLTGTVVEGRKLGRTLGYPTANIEVKEKNKLIPANGIYAVTSTVNGKELKGMMSIGNNPTVGSGPRTLEVNLFDFEDSIYGVTITVHFHKKIRDEKKFADLEALKKAMAGDKEITLQILK